MESLKIVLMGTTDFAVPALDALVTAGHQVVACVAQPDRPNARGKVVRFLPVKKRALELDIPVYQPERAKDAAFVETLRGFGADVFVVAAYGQILSPEILGIPPLGCINIHGSLLPKYRGAAPIHHAIIDGEKVTGVTIMQLDAGMDTGDMLAKGAVTINDTTTVGQLHDELAALGASLLVDTLPLLAAGEITPIPQLAADATYAAKVDRETGHVDWQQRAKQIIRRINGCDPFPGAYAEYEGQRCKLFAPTIHDAASDAEPGTILMADTKNGLVVACGDKAVKIGRLQMPGKKAMDSPAYFAGNTMEINKVLK